MSSSVENLSDWVTRACAEHPDRVAIVDPRAGGELLYRDLEALIAQVSGHLAEVGVRRGDRVGVYVPKSIPAVAAVLGVLRAGAAYVPVDPTGPVVRNAGILADCSVAAVIVLDALADGLLEAWEGAEHPPLVRVARSVEDGGITITRPSGGAAQRSVEPSIPGRGDLAYVLYTSGSTGHPKGVALTHENAIAFINWCSSAFAPSCEDRFSSHAPFHFDLSILDLYLSLKHGATLVLIPENIAKSPAHLAELIEETRITIWYSTPSVLKMLLQFGNLPDRSLDGLRTVLFAGEVFPVKHLRALKEALPRPRFYNLYGPTETNVCTAFEIPQYVPVERTAPYPIGSACPHAETLVVGPDLEPVDCGEEGELLVSGPSVMVGYWGRPDETARAFVHRHGVDWYRTGDLVAERDGGVYEFCGRKDRMVKRRGYRVELDEVEVALYRHPGITEIATVSAVGAEGAIEVIAYIAASSEDGKISLIALKRWCAEQLPSYMIPDRFTFVDTLPRTSTDKVDYRALDRLVST